MKTKFICLLLCFAVLLVTFTGCGEDFPYTPTKIFYPIIEAELTAPEETTTEAPEEETTAESSLQDGVYTCTMYSLTVPPGWTCKGYNASVELQAPLVPHAMAPNISVTVGPSEGDFSKLTFEDMQKNFGTLLGDIEKITFGRRTIGENEFLIIEISYSILGITQYISQAIVHAGEEDITFTLVREALMDASFEYMELLKSLKINPSVK